MQQQLQPYSQYSREIIMTNVQHSCRWCCKYHVHSSTGSTEDAALVPQTEALACCSTWCTVHDVLMALDGSQVVSHVSYTTGLPFRSL